MQPYGAQYLTKHSYHQISALPLPALMSIDDPNFSAPLEIKLKHPTTPLIMTVLMQRAIRYIAVQQLYYQDMQTLSTFVRACNDGVLPVTLTPLAEV
jgi:hypothetical protein